MANAAIAIKLYGIQNIAVTLTSGIQKPEGAGQHFYVKQSGGAGWVAINMQQGAGWIVDLYICSLEIKHAGFRADLLNTLQGDKTGYLL